MEYISAAFGLLLTAGIYCIIPLAVASLCKTSIHKKKYLIICIVGEAVIAFAFQYWRISTGVSGSSFTPAILWATVFYNVGLSILRKRNRLSDCTPPKRTEQPPVASSASTPQPPRSEAVSSFAPQNISPVQPISPPPITETWYTCPACGCLVATGKPCDCGYRPASPEENTPPPKKKRSALLLLLGAALAASLAACCILAGKLSAAQDDISSKDATIAANEKKISSYTATIDNLKSSNEYLEEYNAYLQDDLLHYNLPSDYTSTKNRHDLRIYNNPFLRAMQTP